MTFLKRYQRATEGYAIHSVDAHEAHFSWAPCETCNSKLGGDRYDCTLVRGPGDAASDQIKVASCVDCVLFAANGDLPED